MRRLRVWRRRRRATGWRQGRADLAVPGFPFDRVSELPGVGDFASVPPGFGGAQFSGGAGSGQVPEVTLTTLAQGLQQMHLSLTAQMGNLQMQMQSQADKFMHELSELRAEMVSKSMFQQLEVRVEALEAGGLNSSHVNWLQDQVNRLDPANKSLCFKGFKEEDPAKRQKKIQDFLKTSGVKENVNIEHLFKYRDGVKSILPISIVEFGSRGDFHARQNRIANET